MLSILKEHIIGSIKKIGAGAYCEAYKIYYDRELCIVDTGLESQARGTANLPNSRPSPFSLVDSSASKREQKKPGMDLEFNVTGTVDTGIESNKEEKPSCIKCSSIYKTSAFLVLKEIQFTDRYSRQDFELECKYHTLAYNYMPDLIVKVYDNWIEKYTISPADTLLETRYGIQESKRLPACHGTDDYIEYGYLVLEYMNYKDLYLNYALSKRTEQWQKPINMVGLVLVCLVIIYNLHCKLHICHSDIRDTNIFLSYIGPKYKQELSLGITPEKIEVDTGGFHIKLGDFGLADKLVGNAKTFVFRDYEILENIYQSRTNWQWMVTDIQQYNKLLNFLRIEFIHPINERMIFSNISIENKRKRNEFWHTRHHISQNSVYLYKYPESLLVKYLDMFYPETVKHYHH